MIRWLSQLWVSASVDRGGPPSRLWRWTFGRLASHRRLASQMRQLDGQLKRQAISQQRAISHERLPVGRYTPRPSGADDGAGATGAGLFAGSRGWLRPALTAGSLAVVFAVAWVAWPGEPTETPQGLRSITTESFAQVWGPFARQAEMTGRALRDQTTQVTQLPQRLPAIDQVVNDLGEAIQSPIRDEAQRFADDLRGPWIYLAGQLPRPPRDRQQAPTEG